ncbi:MAG TPA: S41 family peptidase [Bryobacteraceae bacterium]|jgi:carboxyl-terminal processing protease|nr:S41 family peptidase [Bryobacteraceae bacterium]
MKQKPRSLFIIPLMVLGSAVIGGMYGPQLPVASAASTDDDVKSSMKQFTKVYDEVERNFADPVSPDKAIYKGAIPSMLRTLDPHSNFFDPKDLEALREDQRGHYYGVGMSVQGRNGKTIVMAPFVGSPAYKAGLRPGDVITNVNDKATEGLDSTKVADLLKGPKGTPVQITVAREGADKPIVFNIIRDEINRKSVPDAFLLKPGVGYVFLEQFNETTSHEMEEALKAMDEDNLKGLVLDLRGNPGGLLNEAVAVGDHFLPKGDVIVSHKGRASAEHVYTARNGNHGRDYPIVVLVNRNSASAAEIVSGALQDHDRAWIVGDNTFGKGLVQTVYPLVYDTGLALTTAKYYTPSGRLIQRDYSNVSFFDYYYRNNTAERNPADVKSTDSGRVVYGGGGISPDEKYTPPKLDAFETELLVKYTFQNYTRHFFAVHKEKLAAGWNVDQAIMNDLHDYLMQQKVDFTEADYTKDYDWTRRLLQAEIYKTAFSVDESRKYEIKTDPEVQEAMDAMPKAQALLSNARKVIVERMRK